MVVDKIGADDEPTEEQKAAALEESKRRAPEIHDIQIDDKGKLSIDTVNIDTLKVKYYLIDSEVLFSRQPFVLKGKNDEKTSQFSFVSPYEVLTVSAGGKAATTEVPLPERLRGKNLVIEIQSDELQKFKTFFWANLTVQFNEAYGELRVFHKDTQKPLPKTYVKVFISSKGKESFFRDGFTDIRGKFEYANASGKSIDAIDKFAIFVGHEKFGSLVKEVGKPKKN